MCWEVTLSLPPGHLRFVTIITHHENVKKNKNKPLANDGTHPHNFFSKEQKKVPHISHTEVRNISSSKYFTRWDCGIIYRYLMCHEWSKTAANGFVVVVVATTDGVSSSWSVKQIATHPNRRRFSSDESVKFSENLALSLVRNLSLSPSLANCLDDNKKDLAARNCGWRNFAHARRVVWEAAMGRVAVAKWSRAASSPSGWQMMSRESWREWEDLFLGALPPSPPKIHCKSRFYIFLILKHFYFYFYFILFYFINS